MCLRSPNLLFRLPPLPFNNSQSENLFERLEVLAQLLRPRSSHAIRNHPVWLDMAFLPESGRHKLPSYITDILPLKFQHSLVVPTEALVSVVRWILRNGGLVPECGSSAADKRTGWDCDGNYGIKQEPIFPWFFLFTRQYSGDFSEQNCRISFPTHSLTGPGKLFRSAISRIVALYTFPFVVT